MGKRDINTIPSKKFFRAIQTDTIFIPTIVVAETLHTLNKHGRRSIAGVITYFLSLHLVTLDQEFLQAFAHTLQKTIVKTSDVIILITAKLYNAPLITWDKQLLSTKNTICQTLSPKEYLAQQKN